MSALWSTIGGWLASHILDRVVKLRFREMIPAMGGQGWLVIFLLAALAVSHLWAYSRGVNHTEADYEEMLSKAADRIEERDRAQQAEFDQLNSDFEDVGRELMQLRKALTDNDERAINAFILERRDPNANRPVLIVDCHILRFTFNDPRPCPPGDPG